MNLSKLLEFGGATPVVKFIKYRHPYNITSLWQYWNILLLDMYLLHIYRLRYYRYIGSRQGSSLIWLLLVDSVHAHFSTILKTHLSLL